MIKKFIEENDLSFEEGNRNSTITILIGFAQFKEISKEGLEEDLEDEIEEDSFIQDEISRLWNYCKAKNYKKFWTTKEAQKQYKF